MNVAIAPVIATSGKPWFAEHLPELGDYLLLHQGPLVDLQADVHEQLAVLPKPTHALVSVLRAGYLALESAGREARMEIGGVRPSRREVAILYCSCVGLSAEQISAVVGGEPTANERRARELREALESQPAVVRENQVHRSGIRAALAPTMTLAAHRVAGQELQHGQQVGRWEIVGKCGEGGLGNVYEAKEPLGIGPEGKPQFRRAALKLLHDRCLDDSSKQRALEEVRALAACSHPSVIPVWEWGWHGEEQDRLWIVMPFIEGRGLEQRMAAGPMLRDEAERIFVPLAGAIEHLHRQGIFHDDLKPENVLLARTDDDGGVEAPVIIDFGMARQVGQGVRGGTPYWMAPESAEALVPWAEGILTAHTTVVETGVQSHTSTVTFDQKSGRGGGSDVFALALMVRDALQPRRENEWSAKKAARQTVLEALQRRAAETVPGLEREIADVWTVLEPVLRGRERPHASAFGAELATALRAERERRERRIRALGWVTFVSLALLVVAVGRYGYTSMLAAEEQAQSAHQQAQLAREQAALAYSQARAYAEEADTARVEAEREATARENAEEDARLRASQSLAAEVALQQALQAAEEAGASRQQVQRALQLARGRARQQDAEVERLSRELVSMQVRAEQRASEVVRAREQLARTSTRVAELERDVAEERAGRGRDVSALNGQLANARAELETARIALENTVELTRFEEQSRQLQECRTELEACAAPSTPTPATAPGG